MNALTRLRNTMARFARALEGIDDPDGQYMLALEKRIDKLEGAVERVERQLPSSPPDRARGPSA